MRMPAECNLNYIHVLSEEYMIMFNSALPVLQNDSLHELRVPGARPRIRTGVRPVRSGCLR